MFAKLVKAFRLMKMRAAGAKVDASMQLHGRVLYGSGENVSVGYGAWFEMGSSLLIGKTPGGCVGSITIADYFYGNRYATVNSCEKIVIGSRVQLGPFCYIVDFDHDLFSRLDRPFHRPITSTAPIIIGDEVWIGAHAVVLKGVNIGRRAVVAAGAVVTRNVPSDSLVGGVPARVIRDLTSGYRLIDNS